MKDPKSITELITQLEKLQREILNLQIRIAALETGPPPR